MVPNRNNLTYIQYQRYKNEKNLHENTYHRLYLIIHLSSISQGDICYRGITWYFGWINDDRYRKNNQMADWNGGWNDPYLYRNRIRVSGKYISFIMCPFLNIYILYNSYTAKENHFKNVFTFYSLSFPGVPWSDCI